MSYLYNVDRTGDDHISWYIAIFTVYDPVIAIGVIAGFIVEVIVGMYVGVKDVGCSYCWHQSAESAQLTKYPMYTFNIFTIRFDNK